MIRRDYILRMIEEFFRALSRIAALTRAKQFDLASAAIDEEFQKLLGKGADEIRRLSDTELTARLMEGEPTQAVRDKCLVLATLLKEAGALHAAQNRPAESQACHLKALNLLLGVLLSGETTELPDFVPKVEELMACLADSVLPAATNAALMHHYERIGEYAKAEDRLFAMIEAEPGNSALARWGIPFYERLLRQSDAALISGNLPRIEAEASLAELRTR